MKSEDEKEEAIPSETAAPLDALALTEAMIITIVDVLASDQEWMEVHPKVNAKVPPFTPIKDSDPK